jgi:hypothetical protein
LLLPLPLERGERIMKYIITNTERYEVEADSLDQALALYNITFNGIDPEMYDLPADQYYDQDQFEYLDGSTEAREAEKE